MRISKNFSHRLYSFFLLIIVPVLIIIFIDKYRQWKYLKEKYVFYPSNWEYLEKISLANFNTVNNLSNSNESPKGGKGQISGVLNVMYYSVKRGDTLSGIAEKFGMTLDTISSLNRTMGRGVHLLSVGERVRIPTMDGVYLYLNDDFEKFCKSRNLTPEIVLAANGISRKQVKKGMQLFLPGVQHSGIERSIILGVAFMTPVRGIVSSGYGFRHDPFTGAIRFHGGIDIAAPVGRPVRCAMDGRVIVVGRDSILGYYVLVKHPEGFSTLYGHLSRILVSRGQLVKRGVYLGRVGKTGRATGPHLHFEIRFHGRPINPKGMVMGI